MNERDILCFVTLQVLPNCNFNLLQAYSERHYPITPTYNETRHGLELSFSAKGKEAQTFTPEELTAMVLNHAQVISLAHAQSQGSTMKELPTEMALTVPMFATQRERQAILDAAAVAGTNVLAMVDEPTAAIVQYSMDKTFANPEGNASDSRMLVLYNLGASSCQVSLVHCFSYEQPQKYGKPKRVPAIHVLSKAWDATLGGLAWDHVIVEHLVNAFNEEWRKAKGDDSLDVRTVPRALMKIKLQANKLKQVLSANTDVPIHMDALHDDVALHTQITRAQFEEWTRELVQRALQPLRDVMDRAPEGITWANVTHVELVGGGMRVPSVQTALSDYLAEVSKDRDEKLELGLHMNSDESMALGASFVGANHSTAFRVRHIGMTDIHPYSLSVRLENHKEEGEGAATEEEGEPWKKQAVLFKAFGKMGIKKTIAFSHDKNVVCHLSYTEGDENKLLPAGTDLSLTRYQVTGVDVFAKEMKEKGLSKPKVSLQFELSMSGIAHLVKAEAAVEESYTVEEEVEIDEDEDEEEGDNSTNTSNDTEKMVDEEKAGGENETSSNETESDDKKDEKKKDDKKKKKKKTKMVEKVRSRVF